MKCKECDSPDHLVKECPNRVCRNCGESGMAFVLDKSVMVELADLFETPRPHR